MSDFWNYSLACYARPGVSAAALSLQEGEGFDVNLLLWCAWLAEQGRVPGPALAAAVDLAAEWSGRVTDRVRGARRAVKGEAGCADLYQELLAAELASERVLQDRLAELLPQCPRTSAPAADLARQSLKEYAAHCRRNGPFEPFLCAVFSPRETV